MGATTLIPTGSGGQGQGGALTRPSPRGAQNSSNHAEQLGGEGCCCHRKLEAVACSRDSRRLPRAEPCSPRMTGQAQSPQPPLAASHQGPPTAPHGLALVPSGKGGCAKARLGEGRWPRRAPRGPRGLVASATAGTQITASGLQKVCTGRQSMRFLSTQRAGSPRGDPIPVAQSEVQRATGLGSRSGRQAPQNVGATGRLGADQ